MIFFFSSYTTMSRGTMVLLNNNFEQKVKKVKTDKNGNFIIVDMEIQGREISLASIYGPNEDNLNFYETLLRNIADFENENVIVCGDWNLVLDTEKDCFNYLHVNNPRAMNVVLNLMEQENFIDVWRVMNEDKKQYTWRRLNPTKKQARLLNNNFEQKVKKVKTDKNGNFIIVDYFLVSDTTFSFVTHSDIVPGYRTDHSGMFFETKITGK